MGFISKQLLKVIDWKDGAQDIMAYKFPVDDRTEIMNGCQLLVRPSQNAALAGEGRVGEVYPPGRWKLETKSLPLLAEIMSWKPGFDSPFKCDVYYLNASAFSDQNWGTPGLVTMRDKDYGVVRFRAHGTFSYKIGSAEKFLTALFETSGMASADFVSDRLKKLISGVLGQSVTESEVKLAELSLHFAEVAACAKELARTAFESIGIELIDLKIEDISLDEESARAVSQRTKVSAALPAEPAVYEPERQAPAAVARKEESSFSRSSFLAADTAAAPPAPERNMQNTAYTAPAPEPPAAAPAPDKCPMCGAVNRPGIKFCRECGAKMKAVCIKCGCELEAGIKFCGECGEPAGSAAPVIPPVAARPAVCAKCNAKLKEGAKFCAICGAKV